MQNRKVYVDWVCCPVCEHNTRLQIRKDTQPKNFSLYCPKCKQESLNDAKDLQVTIIKETYTKTQGR